MISITLLDRRFKLDERAITLLVQTVLDGEGAGKKSLDLVYCRDSEIIPLNRRFKGHDETTDVLAFGLGDNVDDDYLGEIYINLQKAGKQAEELEVPYQEEVKRLTIHGVLHLLGYRDDSKINRDGMWSRQESYLSNGKTRRRT